MALLLPLPTGTDRRRSRIPWVTYSLIAANIIVYIATFLPNTATPDYQLLLRWGVVPGALHPVTLLTGLFLHVSFSHLFWNMAFLWIFGPHVEDAIGHPLFIVLYFGGGIAGGMLHMSIVLMTAPNGMAMYAPLVGASGAISAILAPYAVRFHRSNIQMLWLPGLFLRHGWARLQVPAVAGLGVWLLQNVVGGVKEVRLPESGEVAYWAHIGGFIFGLLTAELTHLFRQGQQEYLLVDARGAATRGQDLLSLAVQKYRGFLITDPNNASIRAELARTLVQHAVQSQYGSVSDRDEAAREMLAAIRAYQSTGAAKEALALHDEAGKLRLAVGLTPRERLRLSNGALEIGDLGGAERLLRLLLSEAPETPEAEMARLKLGQMLLKTDPAQSKSVLSGFLTRYPDSEWVHKVRDLRAEAERLINEGAAPASTTSDARGE